MNKWPQLGLIKQLIIIGLKRWHFTAVDANCGWWRLARTRTRDQSLRMSNTLLS